MKNLSSGRPIFFIDEIGIKNASYKGKFNFLDFVSFSDELVYRKYLFLARSELLKIKDKHYEIEHSIEHIDCALSFVVPFFENDVIEKLCFDAFSSGKITFDHFVYQ